MPTAATLGLLMDISAMKLSEVRGSQVRRGSGLMGKVMDLSRII